MLKNIIVVYIQSLYFNAYCSLKLLTLVEITTN